jgi:hypothetical protein
MREENMAVQVTGVIFFVDGSKIILKWPRQAGPDPSTVASKIKSALEADRIMAEVDGSLFVIPTRNIKYIQITPAPEKLPGNVLLGAKIVG